MHGNPVMMLLLVIDAGLKRMHERCQYEHLVAVPGHAVQSCFLKAELLLDHPERVLNLGADVLCSCRRITLVRPTWASLITSLPP